MPETPEKQQQEVINEEHSYGLLGGLQALLRGMLMAKASLLVAKGGLQSALGMNTTGTQQQIERLIQRLQ